MSILIKGVEMPVNCAGCPCANDESRYCHAAIKYIPMLGRPDFCPLAEVEERKRGKWIDAVVAGELPVIVCDQCNTFFPLQFGASHNFCPNCGADMRSESDDIPNEYFESGGK